MGKISYEDIDKLEDKYKYEGTKVPSFMKDIDEYRRRLDYIVSVNGLDNYFKPSTEEAREKSES